MPWTKQELFNKALEQRHPVGEEAHLPGRTKTAIRTILAEVVAVWAAQADHSLDELAQERERLTSNGGRAKEQTTGTSTKGQPREACPASKRKPRKR